MINRDIIYIIAVVIICLNYYFMRYNFKVRSIYLKIILLTIVLLTLNFNIQLGILSASTFLFLNQ